MMGGSNDIKDDAVSTNLYITTSCDSFIQPYLMD